MTERLKENVNIPVWLISLIVPLLISIFFIVISNARTQATDNAIFRTSIQGMTERLNRIETKLDTHITVKN